jgi:hypothetical protein
MTSGTLPAAALAEEDADGCLERRCSRRMALASVSMAAGGDLQRWALVSSPAVLLLTALLFLPFNANY